MSMRPSSSLALAREAAVAAEHMCIGVSALGRANYAEHAYYGQAFFALSTGFERTAKLAIVVDHVATANGAFPTTAEIRGFKHDLRKLLQEVDGIAQRRQLTHPWMRLPHSPIHDAIIDVLADFATNITRYYNLDLVTGNPRIASRDEPVAAWYERVIRPVLAAHYKPKDQKRHRRNAEAIQQLIEPYALVRHTSEVGEPLDSGYAASLQTGETQFAKPHVRVYVMQIARFLALAASEIGRQCPYETVPYLPDFFRIFNNDDDLFRRRKTWSIYRL